MEIEFKDIPDFPGYQATNDGRIWSKKSNLFLKPSPQKNGYMRICPYINDKKIYKYVHQLVADAFLGIRKKGFCVDHINEIKSDNKLENLRYVAWGDNAKIWHARNKQAASINNAKKVTPKVASELKSLRQSGVKAKELAIKFKISERTVRDIASGRRWGWVE
jgi:hypothetical protein